MSSWLNSRSTREIGAACPVSSLRRGTHRLRRVGSLTRLRSLRSARRQARGARAVARWPRETVDAAAFGHVACQHVADTAADLRLADPALHAAATVLAVGDTAWQGTGGRGEDRLAACCQGWCDAGCGSRIQGDTRNSEARRHVQRPGVGANEDPSLRNHGGARRGRDRSGELDSARMHRDLVGSADHHEAEPKPVEFVANGADEIVRDRLGCPARCHVDHCVLFPQAHALEAGGRFARGTLLKDESWW